MKRKFDFFFSLCWGDRATGHTYLLIIYCTILQILTYCAEHYLSWHNFLMFTSIDSALRILKYITILSKRCKACNELKLHLGTIQQCTPLEIGKKVHCSLATNSYKLSKNFKWIWIIRYRRRAKEQTTPLKNKGTLSYLKVVQIETTRKK